MHREQEPFIPEEEPEYPAAPDHPPADSDSAAPPYPQAPPIPEAQPEYPAAPDHPPADSDSAAPPYPQAPPAYPPAVSPPARAPIPPPPQPAAGPTGWDPPTQPPPSDLHYHTGRIHLSARQRGADSFAWGQLLLYIPTFLCSFAVVYLASTMLPTPLGWVVLLGWLISGALVFHRPSERAFARYALGLRDPAPQELARLAPVWREVTARAGVDAATYELRIDDSDEVNALAAAGHIVGVTQYAVQHLTDAQLAAVLAHELGHHVGGHSWATLLRAWYAAPARIAWGVITLLTALVVLISSRISALWTLLVLFVIGCALLAVFVVLWYLVIPLLVAPLLHAAIARRSEFRADEHAAALGFAPQLAETLTEFQRRDEAEQDPARRAGAKGLLSTHPEHHARLARLGPFLAPR